MPSGTTDKALLDAAARIVAREGLEGLTMDRLAEETRLSRATVYRRIGSRDALLDALAAAGNDVGERSDTRARILAGAGEVFARVGLDAAAIEEIASAAGVGTATVYRYFGDKDGLVAAFLDDLPPRRAARESAARTTGDLRADLIQFAERTLAGIRDERPLVHLVLIETLRESPLLPRVRSLSPLRTINVVAGILRDHVSELRELDVRFLAESFGALVMAFGVIRPLFTGGEVPDPAETARAIVDVFLRGAAKR